MGSWLSSSKDAGSLDVERSVSPRGLSAPTLRNSFADNITLYALRFCSALLCVGALTLKIFAFYLWLTVQKSFIIVAAPLFLGVILSSLGGSALYYLPRQSRQFLVIYIYLLRVLLAVSIVFSFLFYFGASLVMSWSDISTESQPLAESIIAKEGVTFLVVSVLLALALWLSHRVYRTTFQEYTAYVPSSTPLADSTNNEPAQYGALDDIYSGGRYRFGTEEGENKSSYGNTFKSNHFQSIAEHNEEQSLDNSLFNDGTRNDVGKSTNQVGDPESAIRSKYAQLYEKYRLR